MAKALKTGSGNFAPIAPIFNGSSATKRKHEPGQPYMREVVLYDLIGTGRDGNEYSLIGKAVPKGMAAGFLALAQYYSEYCDANGITPPYSDLELNEVRSTVEVRARR